MTNPTPQGQPAPELNIEAVPITGVKQKKWADPPVWERLDENGRPIGKYKLALGCMGEMVYDSAEPIWLMKQATVDRLNLADQHIDHLLNQLEALRGELAELRRAIDAASALSRERVSCISASGEIDHDLLAQNIENCGYMMAIRDVKAFLDPPTATADANPTLASQREPAARPPRSE